MKKLLLFVILTIGFSSQCFSQTTANQPPDLTQCDFEIFNLTSQIPIILGAQNPDDFTVTFYHTDFDAQNEVNAIANPEAFVGQTQMIYVRVNSNLDNSFAFTQFMISWISTWVPELPDVTACDVYTLPALPAGMYYTGPSGTGQVIPPGITITTSMTLYIFNGFNECSAESSFNITIIPSGVIEEINDIYVCESYELPELPGTLYYQIDGMPVTLPMTITQNTVIGIIGAEPCGMIQSFSVNVGPPAPNITGIANILSICNPDENPFAVFDLTLQEAMYHPQHEGVSYSYHLTLADAENGTNAIPNPTAFVNTVANMQTLYVRMFFEGQTCTTIEEMSLFVYLCTDNTISGNIKLDYDNNGCGAGDIPGAGIRVACTHGSFTKYVWANANGDYTFTNVINGSNVVTLENVSSQFNITPASHSILIDSGNMNPANVDFCIIVANPVTDVSVNIMPTSQARPGFPASYRLFVNNVGTVASSGTVTFQYDDSKLAFTNSSILPIGTTANSLTFNFGPLLPLQQAFIDMTFIVSIPPTVNAGTILPFEAVATTVQTDADLSNNTVTLNQVAVNSFDPNDKTVYNPVMLADNTQDYLRYLVRFQNTGTADAINVRITDQLDQNLDWSTFRPIGASHNYTAQLDTGGMATFTFDNINLPDSSTNEPASHGFVAYEVKLKSGLTVNDDIYNTAGIYFDFNAPIITNTVMTDLVELLGIGGHSRNIFAMYPNPTSEMVTIQADEQQNFAVELFDIQGKKIIEKTADGSLSLDVSMLQKGLYFVKVTTDNATETKKLMVK